MRLAGNRYHGAGEHLFGGEDQIDLCVRDARGAQAEFSGSTDQAGYRVLDA